MEIESREKVKRLLRELFQFDAQDLDFGIYRIMNFKRDAIEKFIEQDLLKGAEEEFKEYAKVGVADLQKEVERLRMEINRDFGEGTIDGQGRVVRLGDAPKIQQYLNKLKELDSAQVTQTQIDDVFNHVYEFFSRYYDKGDFLSKRRYGGREKYYVPYNGEEVLLHWATADQYYVKTGEYFRRYSFMAGAYRVNFVLLEAEVDPNSVKSGNRYFLLHEADVFRLDEVNRELDIHLSYRQLTSEEEMRYGRGNIQERITSEIVNKLFPVIGEKSVAVELKKKTEDDTTLLEQHLRRYVTRNTTDYFIHKDLKGFLERELEFYLKNEVLDLDEIEHMDERNIRLNKAKISAIRGVSSRIITFLAQVEEFQKMLFEKRKFVLGADYCITLDLVPEEFYKEIVENEQQVTEWKELFRLDETSRGTLLSTEGKRKLEEGFLKSHKNLVLDTGFFSQEFKDRLLSTFKDLENKIGGLVIKSENFQALNVLMQKYRGEVQSIYIDPPYNTGSDEFLYKDNYQHSSWLTMIADRLQLARSMLSEDGSIFISIDDHEHSNLAMEMKDIFGEQNPIARIVIESNPRGRQSERFVATVHEHLLVGAKNASECSLGGAFLAEEQIEDYKYQDQNGRRYRLLGLRQRGAASRREDRPDMFFPIYVDPISRKISLQRDKQFCVEVVPKKSTGKDGRWMWGREKVQENISRIEARLISRRNEWDVFVHDYLISEEGEQRRTKLKTIWDDKNLNYQNGKEELKNLFVDCPYDYPKPISLLRQVITMADIDNNICLDFFAGSGTTAHAILQYNVEHGGNRKYILVEMADYFETVLKPRIQKVMYSREWKNGLPASNEHISHMFKYIYLEQYEDALNNIVFRALDKTVQETLESFGDYFIRYMLDYETRDSPTRLMLDRFQTPFDYKIKISRTGEKEEYANVDLVETFNYLLGLCVEKLRVFKDEERTYRVVFGKKASDTVVVIWRNTKDLDLKQDKKFIEETILVGNEPDNIYINGDSYIRNALTIEPEFKRLMGA